MAPPASARWLESFTHVRDPRRSNARHRWVDMFVLAWCAVMSGAAGGEDREDEGQAQEEGCDQFLDLPHGSPSHDPCRRVLSRLKPDEWTPCLVTGTAALRASLDGELVARDGHTRRRSLDQAASQGALPMVHAWAHAHRLV